MNMDELEEVVFARRFLGGDEATIKRKSENK